MPLECFKIILFHTNIAEFHQNQILGRHCNFHVWFSHIDMIMWQSARRAISIEWLQRNCTPFDHHYFKLPFRFSLNKFSAIWNNRFHLSRKPLWRVEFFELSDAVAYLGCLQLLSGKHYLHRCHYHLWPMLRLNTWCIPNTSLEQGRLLVVCKSFSWKGHLQMSYNSLLRTSLHRNCLFEV